MGEGGEFSIEFVFFSEEGEHLVKKFKMDTFKRSRDKLGIKKAMS
jgi:hypothetical protein